jgi:hypothetical protein
MYSGPAYPSGYAKKLTKDLAIRSFFSYASQAIRTTLHIVQLRNPG